MSEPSEYLRSLSQCYRLRQQPASPSDCADRLVMIADDLERLRKLLHELLRHELHHYGPWTADMIVRVAEAIESEAAGEQT